MGDLTKNFNRSEFACRHCGKIVVHPCLAYMLQKIRDETCSPVIINSGFRCLEHNRAIGSQDTSRHVKGTAADIRSTELSAHELFDLIMDMYDKGELPELGGISLYSEGFVHVDVDYGLEGRLRRW
jgi:uncharacterized protein YcbK (DUF882 family)